MSGETPEKDNRCDDDNETPTNEVQVQDNDDVTFSTITQPIPKTPDRLAPSLRPLEMGLPPTPPSRQLKLPDEAMMDVGYDSDFAIGPFVQSGVEEECMVCMDEEEPELVEPIVTPIENAENSENLPTEMAVSVEPELTFALIDKMKVLDLRKHLEDRGMSKNGLKAVLVQRLKEAVQGNVPLLAARPDHEAANNAGNGFDGGAYWHLIEQGNEEIDESIMEVDGIRFREPTATEAEHVAQHPDRPKKRNYSEQFDRPPFVGASTLLPEKNMRGRLRKDNKGKHKYIKQVTNATVPNIEYLHKKGIDLDSHPADWFNIFFPKKRERDTHPKAVTMDELTAWLNTKALMLNAGAGGGIYKNFKNFSKSELMSHLGLYLFHAISPAPQIEFKFKSQAEDPINGSDLCYDVFGNSGVTRHKEFKAFLSGTDPIKPVPPTTSHPNWKVDPLLKHMMRVSKEAIVMGQNISVDEQDIGFQGRHSDKQRISYKKVGDGFLVDALSADGYTFTWYFRNQRAPSEWTEKGLSPLHSRVMSLLQQLPDKTKNYKCGMDNLFMSAKFAKICYLHTGRNVMIHGVCRPSRGVPKCVYQEAVTQKDALLRAKGTVKAATLVGDSTCNNLVALSFYDSKPVYFISNACEKIQWVKKKRKLWHKEKGATVEVPFFRLNIVDEYNYGMGNVDQADQLRLQYRIHYWIRNRKWWWALFFWIFEGSLTNCFVLYRKYYELHERKYLSHYEFIKSIALAWLKPSAYWSGTTTSKTGRSRSPQPSQGSSSVADSSSYCTVAESVISRRKIHVNKKNSTLTNKALDPYAGSLRCRLDHNLNHLPVNNDKPETNCQLHWWASKQKIRAQLMKCSTCNVTLCIKCYKIFHEVAQLKATKVK